MTAPTPETVARQLSMDDVNAYFAREGIHTYRELLEVLQSTDDELEQAEKALAAVTAERDQAVRELAEQKRINTSNLKVMTEQLDQARQMLADAPHDWRCSGEQTGWDRCNCWKAGL